MRRIPLMRAAIDHLVREGQLLQWGIPATGVLVETLLDRGADGDVAEAEAAIERLAAAPADEGLVIREIWLLRLRALLARAHGDAAAYARLSGSLPRHGEIAWLRGPYRVGRGDAMTAVVLYPSMLPSAIMALPVWNSKQLARGRSYARAWFAWGDPKRDHARTPLRSRGPLPRKSGRDLQLRFADTMEVAGRGWFSRMATSLATEWLWDPFVAEVIARWAFERLGVVW